MNYKKMTNLFHDVIAVFDCVIYEVCSAEKDWLEIHLREGTNITAYDFPHLLTIADGYNVAVNIFVVKLNQLGILFKEIG